MLDTLKSTSMGLDGLPDWFIRLAAPAFAQQPTHLFNLSLQQSLVPHQWKSSCITPLPKVSSPFTCQDYRPISVTTILSSLMEKSLVKQLHYPVLINPLCSLAFSDQFGFRPKTHMGPPHTHLFTCYIRFPSSYKIIIII